MAKQESLVSIVDVAQELGISREHLYRLIKDYDQMRLKRHGDRHVYLGRAGVESLQGFH